jgi:hypothetical protein
MALILQLLGMAARGGGGDDGIPQRATPAVCRRFRHSYYFRHVRYSAFSEPKGSSRPVLNMPLASSEDGELTSQPSVALENHQSIILLVS